MSAVTRRGDSSQRDPALCIALRCLTAQRAIVHSDRTAQRAEEELARAARTAGLTLTAAGRSRHPHAMHLRQHVRSAAHQRRKRDRLMRALTMTPATTAAGMRGKVLVALLRVDDERAAVLLRSLASDLRRNAGDAL